MITIIDYGVGNLLSIKNMLSKVGYADVQISSKPVEIQKANKLILPGIGHFDYGMEQLTSSKLIDVMSEQVLQNKIPILGICLGAQLLTKSSEEGDIKGLGWIDAVTLKFDKASLNVQQKIPHMGWNEVYPSNNNQLFDKIENPRFYFVHSYYIKCQNPEDVAATSVYGKEFVSGFQKDNIIGMQFHPEKSHKFGQQFLKNFIKNY